MVDDNAIDDNIIVLESNPKNILEEDDWEVINELDKKDKTNASLFEDKNITIEDNLNVEFAQDDNSIDLSASSYDVKDVQLSLNHIFGPDIKLLYQCIGNESYEKELMNNDKFDDIKEEYNDNLTNSPERYNYFFSNLDASEYQLNNQASWLIIKLKQLVYSGPDNYSNTITKLEYSNLFYEFPLSFIFNENKQKERYDAVFKSSGTSISRATTDKVYTFYDKSLPIEEIVHSSTVLFLKFLLHDKLDLPYIAVHKAHLLYPPLTFELLFLFYYWLTGYSTELDIIYKTHQNFELYGLEARDIEFFKSKLKSIYHYQYLQKLMYKNQLGVEKNSPVAKRASSSKIIYISKIKKCGIRSKYSSFFIDYDKHYEELTQLLTLLTMHNNLDSIKDELNSLIISLNKSDINFELINNCQEEECKATMNTYFVNICREYNLQLTENIELNIYEIFVQLEADMLANCLSINMLLLDWLADKIEITTFDMSDIGAKKHGILLNTDLLTKNLAAIPLYKFAEKKKNSVKVPEYLSVLYNDLTSSYEKKQIGQYIDNILNFHREIPLRIYKSENEGNLIKLLHPLTTKEYQNFNNTDIATLTCSKEDLEVIHNSYKKNRKYVDIVVKFLQYILFYFKPDTIKLDHTNPWNYFISDVIKYCVDNILLPNIKSELFNISMQKSREYIEFQYYRKLDLLIGASPIRLFPNISTSIQHVNYFFANSFPNFKQMDPKFLKNPSIHGIKSKGNAVGRQSNAIDEYQQSLKLFEELPTKSTPTAVAILHIEHENKLLIVHSNEFGILTNTTIINNTLKKSINTQIKDNVKQTLTLQTYLLSNNTRPNVVIIPLLSQSCIELYKYIQSLAKNVPYSILAWETILIDTNIIAKADQSTLFLNNNFQYSNELLKGLSAIRYVICPAAEIACQADKFIDVTLIPLQECLHKNNCQKLLDLILVRYSNMCGFFVNRAFYYQHWRPLLKYISGFGVNQYNLFLSKMQNPITELIELKNEMIPEGLYNQCVSFFRICIADNNLPNINYLDNCMIEPTFELNKAHEMIEACENDGNNTNNSAAPSVYQNPSLLDELDLEQYAYLLNETNVEKSLPLLEHIKDELVYPFKSKRITVPNQNMCIATLSLLNSENYYIPGTMIPIQQKNKLYYIANTNVKVELNNVQIDSKENALDNKSIISYNAYFCDYNINTNKIIVTIDTKMIVKLLSSNLLITNISRSYLLPSLIDKYTRISHGQTINSNNNHDQELNRNSRKVDDPDVLTLSHNQILNRYIMQKPNIDVTERTIITLAEKTQQLLLYLNIYPKPFRYKILQIKEKDEVQTNGLAKNLILNNVIYNSISEIKGTMAFEFLQLCDQITTHKNFIQAKSIQEFIDGITDLNDTVKWGIFFDTTIDLRNNYYEKFILVSIAYSLGWESKKVIKDYILVNNKYFQILGKQFNNFMLLIKWYKNTGFTNRYKYQNQSQAENIQSLTTTAKLQQDLENNLEKNNVNLYPLSNDNLFEL